MTINRFIQIPLSLLYFENTFFIGQIIAVKIINNCTLTHDTLVEFPENTKKSFVRVTGFLEVT